MENANNKMNIASVFPEVYKSMKSDNGALSHST